MKCVRHILNAYDVLVYHFSFLLVKSFLLSLASSYASQRNFVKSILEIHLEILEMCFFRPRFILSTQ